ncbi:MAG: hypothetical protein ACR2PR_00615 [Pseudohongiellaceae bacterium]
MSESQLATALERYIGHTLHDHTKVAEVGAVPNLPVFMNRMYEFYEGQIAGRRCVFLASLSDASTPARVAKHIGLVRAVEDATVIFVARSLSAHNRARLIKHGIPFVVLENQIYLPELAMDLREHFRAPKQNRTDSLSPTAQAVLFHYLLRLDSAATTPSLLAAQLHYSAMSIGRAFNDLAATDFAHIEQRGKEKHIQFDAEGQELLDAMRNFLRSPVRSEKFVRGSITKGALKLAGESALSERTELSAPPVTTFAVVASDWKKIAQAHDLVETGQYEADCIVETWAYNPAALSDAPIVDPLSLHAQFHDHQDERVSIAADALLEDMAW